MPLFDAQADLAEMIEDFPSELSFDGKTVSCFIGEIETGFEIIEAGEYEPKTFQVLAVKADLRTVPTVKNTIIVDDVKYHVTDVQERRDGIMVFGARRWS